MKKRIARCLMLLGVMLTVILGCEQVIETSSIRVTVPDYEGAAEYQVTVGGETRTIENASRLSFIINEAGTYDVSAKALDAEGNVLAVWNKQVPVIMGQEVEIDVEFKTVKRIVTFNVSAVEGGTSYFISLDGAQDEQITAENGRYIYKAELTKGSHEVKVTVKNESGEVIVVEGKTVEVGVKDISFDIQCKIRTTLLLTVPAYENAASYVVKVGDDIRTIESNDVLEYEFDKACTVAVSVEARNANGNAIARYSRNVDIAEARLTAIEAEFQAIYRNVTFKVAEVANAGSYYMAIDGAEPVELKNTVSLCVGSHTVVITAKDADGREMGTATRTFAVGDVDATVDFSLNLHKRVFLTLKALDGATRYAVDCGGKRVYDGAFKAEAIYAVVDEDTAISVSVYKGEKQIASWVNTQDIKAGDNNVAVGEYVIVDGKITVNFASYDGAVSYKVFVGTTQLPSDNTIAVANGKHKIRIEAYDADGIMIAERDAEVTVNYNDLATERYVLAATTNTLAVNASYDLADSYKVSIDGKASEAYTAPITLNCGKHTVVIEALKGSVVYARTSEIEVSVRHDKGAVIETATFTPEKGRIEFSGMAFARATSYEVSIDGKTAVAPYEVSFGTHAVAIKALDAEKRVVATWNGDVAVEAFVNAVSVSFAEIFRDVTFNVETIADAAKYYIAIDGSEAVELKNPVKLNVGSHTAVITARDAEDREMASLAKTVVVNDVNQSVAVTLDLYTRVFITLKDLDGATRFEVKLGGTAIYDGAYTTEPVYAVATGNSAAIDIAVFKADGRQIASLAKTYNIAKGDNSFAVDAYEVRKANISADYNTFEGADSYRVFVDSAIASAGKAIPVENGKHVVRIEAYQGDILIADYDETVDVFYDDVVIKADLTGKTGSLTVNSRYDLADSYKVSIDGKASEAYTDPIALNCGKHTVVIEALKGSVVYARTSEIEVIVRHDTPASIDTAFLPEKGVISLNGVNFVGADSYVVEIDGIAAEAPYEVDYGTHTISVKAYANGKAIADWTGTPVVEKPSVLVDVDLVAVQVGSLSIDVASAIMFESGDRYEWYLNGQYKGSLTVPGKISVVNLEPGDYTVRIELIAHGDKIGEVSKTYTVGKTRIEDSLTVDYIPDPNNMMWCNLYVWNLSDNATFRIDGVDFNTYISGHRYHIGKNLPYGHHVLEVTDNGASYEYGFEARGHYRRELSLIDGKLVELSGSTPSLRWTVYGAELNTPVEYSVSINGDYSGYELKWFMDDVEVLEARGMLSMSYTFTDSAAVGDHSVRFEMYQSSTGRYVSETQSVNVVEKAEIPVFTINTNQEYDFYDHLTINGNVTGNAAGLWKFRWYVDGKPYGDLSTDAYLRIDSYILRDSFNVREQNPLRSYNLKLQAERSGADPVELYNGNFSMLPSFRVYCSDIYEGMDFNVQINTYVDSRFSEHYINGILVNGNRYDAIPNRDEQGRIRDYTVKLPDTFKAGDEITISVDVSRGKSKSVTKTIELGSARIRIDQDISNNNIRIMLENNDVFPADAEMHWYMDGDRSQELYVRSEGSSNSYLSYSYCLDVPVDVVPGNHSIDVEIICNGRTFTSDSIRFDIPAYEYHFYINTRHENDVPVEAWVSSPDYDVTRIKPDSYRWYNKVDGQEPVYLGSTPKFFLVGGENGQLYCEFVLADGRKSVATTYLDSSSTPSESNYEIRGTGEYILEGAELDKAIANDGMYPVELGVYDIKTGKLVSLDDFRINWNLSCDYGPNESHENVNPLILNFNIYDNQRFRSLSVEMKPVEPSYGWNRIHDDNGVSLYVNWADKITFENADRVFYSYETSSKPGEEAYAYMTTLVLDDVNHTFKLDRAFVNTAMVESQEPGGPGAGEPGQAQKQPMFGYDVENIKGTFTEAGNKLTLRYGTELAETEDLTIDRGGLVRDKYHYGERFELLSGNGTVVNKANPHLGTWRLPQVTIADSALNEVASQYLDPMVQGMFQTFNKAIEFGELEIDPTDPTHDGNSVKADIDLRFEKNVLRIYGNVSLHAYLLDRKLELGQPFDVSAEASFPYEVVPENKDLEVWNQRMPLKFNVSKDGKVMVVTAAFFDPMQGRVSQITFPLVRIDENEMRKAGLAGGKPFDADKIVSLTDMGPIARQILEVSGIGPDLEMMVGMPVTLPDGNSVCVTGRWNIDKSGRSDLANYPDVFNVIGSELSADGFMFFRSMPNNIETLVMTDSVGREYELEYSNIRLDSDAEGNVMEIVADVTLKKKGGYITRLKDVKAVKAAVGIEDVVDGFISSFMEQAPFEIIFKSEGSDPDYGNLVYRTDEFGFDLQIGRYAVNGNEMLLGVDVFDAMMSKYDNVSTVVYGRFPFDPVTGRVGLLTDKDGNKYGYVVK